ncbi:sentrin-specific protease 7b [Aplochiton taeniatus]
MAAPYKIPKKKQPTECDSMLMQSPLSRLQDSPDVFKRCGQSAAGTLKPRDSQRVGNLSAASFDRRRPKRASDRLLQGENLQADRLAPPREENPHSELEDSEVTLDSPVEWESSSSPERTECPRRTADRLGTGSLGDPKWRKADFGGSGSSLENTQESTALVLSSSSGPLRNGARTDTSESSSLLTSDEDPCDLRRSTTPERAAAARAPSSSSSSSTTAAPVKPQRPWTLNRTSLLNRSDGPRETKAMERLGERGWRSARLSLHLRIRRPKPTSTEPIVLSSEEEEEEACREGPASISPRPRNQQGGLRTPEDRPPPTQAGADRGPGDQRAATTAARSTTTATSARSAGTAARSAGTPPPPSVIELPFLTLHAGTVPAQADGNVAVTENCIMVPLKDPESECGPGLSLSLAASELRGYGVWDGALAQDGALLGDWEGPAPSLLFLWLSKALANLVQMELSPLQPVTHAGQSCPFLILVLREQLSDLQSALLASRLESGAFGRGAGCSPLPWSDGLALVHSCPQEAHLLSLLGQGTPAAGGGGGGGGAVGGGHQGRSTRLAGMESSDSTKASQRSREAYASSRRQGLPSRLIQYPFAPCKGRIAVTTEDLDCLDSGEFLNDVIIDFYLKFLLLERAERDMADRCHIFSSFFYKQLTRRHTAGEPLAIISARERRHQRVKTWTRHVDIFTKDYLFVPVNHEAHWYLVVICFPRLEEAQHEEWSGPASAEPRGIKRKLQPQAPEDPQAERPRGTFVEQQTSTGGSAAGAREKPTPSKLRSISPPPYILPFLSSQECSRDGCHRETVCRRACILVMDSLKLSHHEDIYKLLREYLQVEWEVRRGTPRPFTPDTMLGSHCRVPLQDNSSDCGLYLLQYVECFLQNPVVHFDLPLRLERWFLRQRVWRKREEIKSLIRQMHQNQQLAESTNR